MKAADVARVAYLRWLSRYHPPIYKRAVMEIERAPRLGALGWINFVVQAVAAAGSLVLAKKQAARQSALAKKQLAVDQANALADRKAALQVALLDVNTKRAQAGLAPVDENGNVIASGSLPNPPELAPFREVGQAVSKYGTALLIGGATLLVFIYIRRR